MVENRKDNETGLYYVSKAQLIMAAGGLALTSAIIFLLGILIGQGIEERKLLKQEQPLVKVPLGPLAPGARAGQAAPGKDELTFYDTLSKSPAASPAKEVKTVEKVSPPAKPSAPRPEVKEVKETRTAKAAAPAETPPAVKETKTAKASPPAEAAPAAKETRPAKAAEAPAQKTAENNNKAEPPKPEEEKATARVWTVQVNAYPEEARAQRTVERLKEKGYDAYLVAATIKEKVWYRVRVGHFATRAQTKDLIEELQNKESFTKAIAVSK